MGKNRSKITDTFLKKSRFAFFFIAALFIGDGSAKGRISINIYDIFFTFFLIRFNLKI